MTVAVGVIGCGYWAQRHLQAWSELGPEGARLAAVCDRDPVRARDAAARFGVEQWFTDAGDMLARVPLGLIDIATQMDAHRALAEQAFEAGVPVIVQKPVAPDFAGARAIAAAASASGTWCAVHENFRFQPAMVQASDLLHAGMIGAPTWARFSYRLGPYVYGNQPYFRDEGRLIILDLGIHLLDLARVLLGPVERVFCETQRRDPANRAEDTATMVLRHRSGAVSTIDCTYEDRAAKPNGPELEVVVEAVDGTLSAPAGGRALLVKAREGVTFHRVAAEEDDVFQASVRTTCSRLLHSLRSGVPAPTAIADNLQTYALVEAAYESAATGLAVEPAL